MSIDVTPVNICEICCNEFISKKDNNKFKCWKPEPHLICKDCCKKESQRRKDNGFKNPNECILCKPFQQKVENNTTDVISIEITNNHSDDNTVTLIYTISTFILIIIVSSIVWNISVVIWNMCHGETFETQKIEIASPIEIIGGFVILVLSSMILSPFCLCLLECSRH